MLGRQSAEAPGAAPAPGERLPERGRRASSAGGCGHRWDAPRRTSAATAGASPPPPPFLRRAPSSGSRRAPRWRRPLRGAGLERGRLRRGRGADRWVAGGAGGAAGAGRLWAGGGAGAEPPSRRRRRRRRRREPRPRDKKGRGRRCALRVRRAAERAWEGERQAGEREAVPSPEPPPSLAAARPPSLRNPGTRGTGRAGEQEPPGAAAPARVGGQRPLLAPAPSWQRLGVSVRAPGAARGGARRT